MYDTITGLSETLRTHHATTWERIAQPGAHWSAADRLAMVHESRAALACTLCKDRKAALSPNHISGEHDEETDLHPDVVDTIHRLRTDPGRLTRAWFDRAVASVGLTVPAYVELVSVVTCTVIIDTLHNALGLGAPTPLMPRPGQLTGEVNSGAIDIGAWVPVLDAGAMDGDALADTGLPQVPNIARSLGLVPSALELFFHTFRPHYALKDIPLSISQAQAELVAARVSAVNECFY